MIEHGELDEHGTALVLGEKLLTLVDSLRFTGAGLAASTVFGLDDKRFKLSVLQVSSDD